MYERFLPKFKAVEINVSTAHKIGHAISQVPAYCVAPAGQPTVKAVEKGAYKFIENGLIVGLTKEGVLANYDETKSAQPCLVYNDELPTGPFDNLEDYAEEVEDRKPVYLRALPLYLGDSFTTNNFSNTAQDGWGKVVNGVIDVQGSADKDTLFIAKKTTMPNGEEGMEFTYCGHVVAAEA